MKISWGTAIVLVMVSFITFIMYFVITMIVGDKYSHDLVTEEYYKTELSFQQQLDKEQNATLLNENITVQQTSEGLVITFPAELEHGKIEGKVFLYRPSNKQLDSEFPLTLLSNQLLLPDSALVGGRWNIGVDWSYEGEDYYFKTEIIY